MPTNSRLESAVVQMHALPYITELRDGEHGHCVLAISGHYVHVASQKAPKQKKQIVVSR